MSIATGSPERKAEQIRTLYNLSQKFVGNACSGQEGAPWRQETLCGTSAVAQAPCPVECVLSEYAILGVPEFLQPSLRKRYGESSKVQKSSKVQGQAQIVEKEKKHYQGLPEDLTPKQ